MVQKKFFRRTSVVFLAILVFSIFSLNVMGATYTTSTTYDAGTGAVSVVSEVIGAADNEEIAYLAYKGENPAAAGAIVYIDQDTADENGEKIFTYSTTRDDFVTATVKFGGNASADFAPQSDGDDVLPGYRAVNFTVYGDGAVHGVDIVDGTGTLYVPKNANTTINFEPGVDSILETVTVNGQVVEELATESYTVGPVADESEGAVEIEVFFVEVDSAGTITAIEEGTDGIEYSGTSENSSENFIQVLASTNVGSGYEYGIAYSLNEDFSDPHLYRAYGRGNTGLFIVRLENGEKDTIQAGKAYYAKAYVKHLDSGEITYGALVTINVD